MLDKSNLIDQIKHDHRELEEYYGKYKSASTLEEGNKWFNQFIFEVSRHSVGEEQVLYPLMESLNEKGKELAEESRVDHRELKLVLSDLMKEKDDKVFAEKMDKMMSDLREHIKKEETNDLVFIADNVSPEKLEKAGGFFSLKKKIVPTRPHPNIPDKPWALEAALGVLTSPFDKFKDLFTEFPEKKEL